MLSTRFSNILILGAAVALCEYIFRFGLATWELKEKSRRYPKKNRVRCVIKNSFHQDKRALVASGVFVGTACAVDIAGFFKTAAYLLPPYISLRILNYQRSLIDAANWIREGSGIDFATGMAYNYFHGYINLQLAERSNGIPGIRDRLKNYEAHHGVYVPVKRLFILVPHSLHSKPDFSEPGLKAVEPVEVVNLDRAGCVERPFRTGVYRMIDEETGAKWYAAIEGATPLESFQDALNYELTRTPIMKQMKREILLQFYKALKRISDSPQFRKSPVFEVIYYNDLKDDGSATLISEVVKKQIREMKRRGLD